MNSELNYEFVHCFRCYRQPTRQASPFVVCNCKHIFCDDCHRCDRHRTKNSMYCFVCRKSVPAKPITQDLAPAHVRRQFESTDGLLEQFGNTADFQGNIQDGLIEKLFKDIEYLDKVDGDQDSIENELKSRCQKLERYISTIEANSLQHMSQERYTQLLNMADNEINQMSYRQLVGASTSDGHAFGTPQPLRSSVNNIDPHTPLLRQVLLKNAYSRTSSSQSPN